MEFEKEKERARLERITPLEERYITYGQAMKMLHYGKKSRTAFYIKVKEMKSKGVVVTKIGKSYLIDVVTLHLWILENANN